LMLTLFRDLKELHRLDDEWLAVVKTSAQLHESGVAIHHVGQERHAFYMIMNADLYGLTPRELVLSAFTASMDRKQKIRDHWKNYEQLLLPTDKQAVRMLGLLLRLAVALDRTKTGAVRSVRCTVGSDEVRIHLDAAAKPLLELSEAYALRASFRKLLKRELVIEA